MYKEVFERCERFKMRDRIERWLMRDYREVCRIKYMLGYNTLQGLVKM